MSIASSQVRRALTRGWGLILLLLFARGVLLAVGPGILNGDGFRYVEAAQHLLQTGTMPPATAQSRSFSVILAPIVAMLGHDTIWTPISRDNVIVGQPIANLLHYFQIALDLFVVAALLRLFQSVRPQGRRFYIAGLLAITLQPITAAWTNFVLPDSIATFGFFAGLYLVARSITERPTWRLLVGALLMGFASFLRFDLLPLSLLLIAPWCVLLLYRYRTKALAGVVLAMALFAVPSAAMMGLQYASQGDMRYVVADSPDNPSFAKGGYFAWTRAWLMTQTEFRDYAFAQATPDWPGFRIDTYPARAFVDPAHRAQAAAAIAEWKATGYTPAVDAQFVAVAERLRASKPFQRYVVAPGARTAQLWINQDGAAALKFSVDARPPWSAPITILVVVLKVLFALLALVGSWVVIRTVMRARFDLSVMMDWPNGLALLSLAALFGRAAEMWLLNIVVSSAVMESRYVIEFWPCLIVLAAYGYRTIATKLQKARARSVDASAHGG